MRVGDLVRIKKFEHAEGVVGERAEVVDMQIQEYERYRTYPIWAKVISGKYEGKVFGFREGEVEMLLGEGVVEVAAGRRQEVARTRVAEQLEEILKGVATAEEFAEVEKTIAEVKGKVLMEAGGEGFWEDKTPCWEMLSCPEEVRNECPSYKYRSLPCWEIEGTYCKLDDYGATGDGTDICQHCRVYRKWGAEEPIEVKLRGKGFTSAPSG